MVKYYPLKYPFLNISMECSECGWFLQTKDGIGWFCKKCNPEGRIKDLFKTQNSGGKVELSKEWKKLTGEKN